MQSRLFTNFFFFILILVFFIILLNTLQYSGEKNYNKNMISEPVKNHNEEFWKHAREIMVEQLVSMYGITNNRILSAMRKIPRHLYIPEEYRKVYDPYGDHPCPIGYGQTISQPYIVAYMTQVIDPTNKMKVLEIGTGSGYQAAVLAELGAEVYTIEIIPELGKRATETLKNQNYTNIHVKIGDGYKGWPEHAPFDAIIVTCAPEEIPEELVKQLKDGGKMILPLGTHIQNLVTVTKKEGKLKQKVEFGVRFVPMVRSSPEDKNKTKEK